MDLKDAAHYGVMIVAARKGRDALRWASRLGNILADGSGEPALIDPAVSCTWPEIDLAMLWVQRRPPDADRFFTVYEELARPFCGWQDQAQLLRIWDLFSTVAHGPDTWSAAEIVRKLIAPFRRSTASRSTV
jgi:fructosamine-3-kinase